MKSSRRFFLRTVGAVPPTLKLMLDGTPARAAARAGAEFSREKFTPVDLTRVFTGSPANFGPREKAKQLSGDSQRDGLIRPPTGAQNLRGIPFQLGAAGVQEKSWIVLEAGLGDGPGRARQIAVPVAGHASFVCLAAFCDWDPNEAPPVGSDAAERVGQHLADLTLLFQDGSKKTFPIRRRFEVNSPSINWGHLCFTAEPHLQDVPTKLTDPLPDAREWGRLQTAVLDNHYPSGPDGWTPAQLWISAFRNPEPDRPLKAVEFTAVVDDPLVVCGVTLFHGREHPLRYERLTLYRITLPEPAAEDEKRWNVEVDLGVVARTYALEHFEAQAWLGAPDKGLGARRKPLHGVRYLYAEVTASADATLTLADAQTGKRYEFALGSATAGQELEALPAGARVEVLEREKAWLRGQVVDSSTGRPTPVRLAFRSKEGRYIPPYGHRTDINNAWFEDYGADLKLMDTPFAYVDGSFEVELPVGDVYVEMTKGFEYEAVRGKLNIEPGQRELKLEMPRLADLRSRGWVSADTHVHFLSPSTAVLEGQAEGLNLINLLAAQWGDLFTNVGDISHGPLTSRDGEMLVQIGTENRQHLLGHLALLGARSPVYPMSAGGPEESYLGDPLWRSLADWTDDCRERGGLAVVAHFPYPKAEVAADIVLGKIEAVEIYPDYYPHEFNTPRFIDWYRCLNCGYRLPVVGGTDKMGAYMPVGANRTYAHLGQEEFNFANWAKAVRRGNTFMSSGPLLEFAADGHPPGDEIGLGGGGGTIEVAADAKCFVPIHVLEIVMNGRVVASRRVSEGARQITLREKLQVPGAAWLAARCFSNLGPTTNWEFKVVAHTSPVYVKAPGQELFSADAAAYLLTLIEGARTWVETIATRPDPERYARIQKMLADAHDRLHQRLHAHGIEHSH